MWTLENLNAHLVNHFGDQKTQRAFQKLDEIIVKTFLTVEPSLLSYFESLGHLYR